MKNIGNKLKKAGLALLGGGLVVGAYIIYNNNKKITFDLDKMQSRDTVEVEGLKYDRQVFKNGSVYTSIPRERNKYDILSNPFAVVLVDKGNDGIDYKIHCWRSEINNNSIFRYK